MGYSAEWWRQPHADGVFSHMLNDCLMKTVQSDQDPLIGSPYSKHKANAGLTWGQLWMT